MGFIMAIVIGGLAGWIASMIMKADTGLLLNVVLGIVGASLANFLFGLIGLGPQGSDGFLGRLVVATIGACLLIWIVRMVRGRAA
jgi:uncharacterized membrane protein YeaQ/YmgE (transglycosylase-associated protein family)